ncbi:hypothetical protein LUZ63_000162 [Rhynchospora breviuscula]|uniref:Uncharacterized protein n=1 Tax=Rhynchospora breviuscula TaxID=2022672 RepID=A0A9Q0CUT2_9POAL|nr:hypothetical protein LUZ63_000162 [Rhynchospora breviuscula]
MVEVLESCFVVPSDETPKERLWLSNLDQVAPRGFVGSVYFYKRTDSANFFSVEVLKASLSKALVLFYPLAGRYAVGSDGRLVLDCNGEGCFFVRARLDRAINNINFQPSPELERLFVPSIEMAGSQFLMLMIQVTYLKCGGVVVGFAFNHVFGDGRCSFHFIRTWASITRGDLSSIVPPSFDQMPVRARSPPIVKFDHPEYMAEHAIKSTLTGSTTTKFFISKEQVHSLKTRCSNGCVPPTSSFCAVVSLVWKCYCDAQGLDPDTTANLMFTVDIRDRLKPPLPKHHFSNAVVRRSVQSKVSEITSNPLSVVAERVKLAIDSVNDEYVRSLIDYLEIVKNKVFATKHVPESHLRVVSISRMPVYDADFGFGAPDLVSRWKVTGNRVVYISDKPGVNGGIEVVVTVDSPTMRRFEKMFYEELNAGNENSSSAMQIRPKSQIGQSKL